MESNMMPGMTPSPIPSRPPVAQPQMTQPQMTQQQMNDLMNARVMYPEIYYKIQPHIMLACDQMDAMSNAMPTQEMVDSMADNIYSDVRQMYPDLSEYADNKAANPNEVRETVTRPFYGGYGRPFRRRGALRDIVEILLLSELFGRRRRRWW